MDEIPNLRIIPGDPLSPFILHVPHSSRFIPDEVRSDILLTDEDLKNELDEMTDSHTEVLAETAARESKIRPWIFLNTLSRLVIDPERFPDAREQMNTIGMGAVYQSTSTGKNLRRPDEGKEKDLLEKFFHPYARVFENFVTRRLSTLDQVIIVDVHSYRARIHMNSLNKGLRRPAICIGVDGFHTPEWLQERAKKCFSQIGDIAINEPYSGTYVPLTKWGVDAKVSSIMMENRADTFVDDSLRLTQGFKPLAQALTNFLNEGSKP